MIKVMIPIPEGQWHGSTAEHVWATRGPWKNTAVLRNIPIHANGVSLGDTVRYRREDRLRIMTEVIARSGHSTYRALAGDGVGVDDPRLESLVARLNSLGCSTEDDGEGLFAIDVPPSVHKESLETIFAEGEKAGLWEIDCGYAP